MRRSHTRSKNTNANPPIVAAYGLRKINAGYSGPAVRVRRSSDNVEADIGFNADGTLNETTLTTHVGANSGFVTTWYDQSGNNRPLVQATAAQQPRIVNSGVIDRIGSKPAVFTDGVDDAMDCALFSSPQPWSLAAVIKYVDNTPNPAPNGQAVYIGTNGNRLRFNGPTGQLCLYAGSIYKAVGVGINSGTVGVVNVQVNGSSSIFSHNDLVYDDGTNPGSGSLSGIAVGNLAVGGPYPASAYYGEIICMSGSESVTYRQLLDDIQMKYWGLR